MTDPTTDGDRRVLAPAKGARVRKPDGTVLADAGEAVLVDTYWQRRLDHGDVVEKAPPKPTTAKDAA